MVILLAVGMASMSDGARYRVWSYAGTPPYPGWLDYTEIISVLMELEDDPELDSLSNQVLSLFHGDGATSRVPGVQGQIVFAWLDGERLLLADERGYASLGNLAESMWENGWYDFAMLSIVSQESSSGAELEVYATESVRIQNRTGLTLLLLDDAGEALSPEEGDRLLARVPPGSTIERPVLRRRSPWLAAPSGPKMRLDVTVSQQSEASLDGLRFTTMRVRLGGVGTPPRWRFVVLVEDDEARRFRAIALAGLTVLAGWVPWMWWRTRSR